MARVLITRALPSGSLDPLVDAGHKLVGPRHDDRPLTASELAQAISDVDGVVCLLTDRIDAAVIGAGAGAGRLRVISNVAAGYDNIDIEAAHAAGIAVCSTAGVVTAATADLAMLLMLSAGRGTGRAERELRQGGWKGWNILEHLGHEVHGRTLGIVGWGGIGREVAKRAAGFDMHVLHHSRRDSGEPGYVAALDDLLGIADFTSLHVPLNASTLHLIDARRLALMKSTAVIVNTSRGPVIDEQALALALHARQIWGAGLDVFEREPQVEPLLLSAPNAVLFPHVGTATWETRLAMGRLATQAAADELAGRSASSRVRRSSA